MPTDEAVELIMRQENEFNAHIKFDISMAAVGPPDPESGLYSVTLERLQELAVKYGKQCMCRCTCCLALLSVCA